MADTQGYGFQAMAQESLLRKIDCALHVICHAFASIADSKSENESLRIEDAIRSSTRRERQSLRWTLPFLWMALVYLSFVFSYSTVRSCVPVLTETENKIAAKTYPFLICSRNDDEHSPDHGDNPHGPDPHDEIHDPELPSNADQPDYFEKKDAPAKPK